MNIKQQNITIMEYEIIKNDYHKRQDLLSIILYTDKHPHIKKCLRDNDYWLALDESSGFNWKIFAVKPMPGDYRFPKTKPNTMQMMVMIWDEPADNKPIIEFLGLNDTKDLPLIFFYKLEDNEIEDEICVKIEGNTEQEVYNDLQNIINKVSKSIEKGGDLFENAKSTIKKEKIFRAIKKGKKILSDFNSLIPGIF
jgi:hypothetical protein